MQTRAGRRGRRALVDADEDIAVRTERNSSNVLPVLEGKCEGFVTGTRRERRYTGGEEGALDEIKDRDTVADRTDDRVSGCGKEEVALGVDGAAEVRELEDDWHE